MSENESVRDNSQEEVQNKPKAEKAKKFRKEHGYSLTMHKLMKKWNCATIDAWRTLRKTIMLDLKPTKIAYLGKFFKYNRTTEIAEIVIITETEGRN